MSDDHRNGFTCGDAEDRIDDLEAELSECHRSLARIETWLGITDELDVARLQANIDTVYRLCAVAEDARAEATERVWSSR